MGRIEQLSDGNVHKSIIFNVSESIKYSAFDPGNLEHLTDSLPTPAQPYGLLFTDIYPVYAVNIV